LQVARNAAATAASTLLSLKEPPLFEVNNKAVHSSPAKSTLTPGGKSCNIPLRVSAEDEMSDLLPLPASWNKANKVTGKFGVEEKEQENGRKDNNQAEGGDSNKEGEEADLNNIALAQGIIHDDLCAEVFTSADAQRIVLDCHDEDDADQIDNDIGEPGNDTEEDGVYLGLVGAPKGWLALTPPLTFSGYVPKHDTLVEEAVDNPPAGVCLLSSRCTETTSTNSIPLQQEYDLSLQTKLGSNASTVGNSITKIGRLRSLMRKTM
jgi:hypothetical protein